MNPKLVLITGASGGIGLATVHAFAAARWQVLAASRTPERIDALATVRAIRLDPCSAADRHALVELLDREHDGRLDCLVNNAGYAQSGPVELLDEAAWREQLEVNLVAPALLVAAVLPALRKARGSVINLSSMLGRTGFAWQGAYCASKFGLEGWTESLMLETQGQGVRVHLIEPGATRSEFGRRMRRPSVLPEPYGVAAERFAAMRQGLAGRAQPAERVAGRILETAQRPSLRFRQFVGRDAAAIGWLMGWLPSSAYLAFARAVARRWLGLPRGSA